MGGYLGTYLRTELNGISVPRAIQLNFFCLIPSDYFIHDFK